MPVKLNKRLLEQLYRRYNSRKFVHPDPLEFLYCYEKLQDREIAGLIASCLAYGRVAQILRNVSLALGRMGPPAAFLRASSADSLRRDLADFKHRFTTGDELAAMLFGAKLAMERHGSLYRCFQTHANRKDETVVESLSTFVDELRTGAEGRADWLLPSPRRGSACKRLNLFLRWMVRRDAVDPGGWDEVPPSKLIIPLDAHMHRASLELGLTRRKQQSLKAALEITAAFREVAPHDPVRYDFALTRLGIRKDADMDSFLSRCREEAQGGKL